MRKIPVKTLTTIALLIAMEVILSRFLSFSTANNKIGFAFVPLAVCAALYGPVWGAVAGGLADFLGAVLFPIGPYFPGFTLSTALTGAVYGIFLRRKPAGVAAICAATLINNLVISLFLSTLWISMLYGAPYKELLITQRIPQCAILVPLQLAVLLVLRRPIVRLNLMTRR